MRSDARRNRDRILQVAREAFATDGLSIPLDEIARRAHLGPGTLYRHFPTKESLYEAIILDHLHDLVDRTREALTAPDPADALFTALGLVVADAEAKGEIIDALTGANVDVQSKVAARSADLRDGIALLLTRAQEQGGIRRDVGVGEVMALLGGVILAIRSRTGDPQRALTILRDGLRDPLRSQP
ncbi:TetR/AcrR family transcriptional regulator [Herbidospora mongoliensis]|uniref:TetR/AcrR family transcriptional regulator n=1 Tax=Herbidospora mongoliensis TaxID=688067 RepID=UPI00082F7397|nr:TetR/AcrR family transcriptional regulator [Herbidospora mongoliensis]